MGLENRIIGIRGSGDLRVPDSELDYPPNIIYRTYKQFGIGDDILKTDLIEWTDQLSNKIEYYSNSNSRRNALVDLNNLYLESKSEIVRDRLMNLYMEGYFKKFNLKPREFIGDESDDIKKDEQLGYLQKNLESIDGLPDIDESKDIIPVIVAAGLVVWAGLSYFLFNN